MSVPCPLRHAPPAPGRRTPRPYPALLALAIACLVAGGCARPPAPDAAGAGTAPPRSAAEGAFADATRTADALAAASGTSKDASAAADPGNVCTLLTLGEVRSVFPGAGPGIPERTREKYGITACVWEGAFGRVALQQWDASATAEEEVRSMTSGFVDPLQRGASANVRFEPLPSLGDKATAVVETQDASKGILTDVAMMATTKDGKTLFLLADDLPHRERAAALAALQSLGQSARGRL